MNRAALRTTQNIATLQCIHEGADGAAEDRCGSSEVLVAHLDPIRVASTSTLLNGLDQMTGRLSLSSSGSLQFLQFEADGISAADF